MAEQRRLGYRHPGVLRCDGDFVESLLDVGDVAGATAHLREFETRVEATASPWGRACLLRCQGLLALARHDQGGAVERLSDAARTKHGDPLEHARTLLALGGALRRARRRVDAQAVLRSAMTTLQSLGAETWHARAAAEFTRAGGSDPGTLSDAASHGLGLSAAPWPPWSPRDAPPGR